MATVTRAKRIVEIMNDAPRMWSLVYKYEHFSGVTRFAIFESQQFDDIHSSPFAKNIVCLMANAILTEDGKKWLKENEDKE